MSAPCRRASGSNNTSYFFAANVAEKPKSRQKRHVAARKSGHPRCSGNNVACLCSMFCTSLWQAAVACACSSRKINDAPAAADNDGVLMLHGCMAHVACCMLPPAWCGEFSEGAVRQSKVYPKEVANSVERRWRLGKKCWQVHEATSVASSHSKWIEKKAKREGIEGIQVCWRRLEGQTDKIHLAWLATLTCGTFPRA